LSLITEVGAPLNASIRSDAGFGTLVIAVVMLIKTVSPLRLRRTSSAVSPTGATSAAGSVRDVAR
jgi:hypothetical protein